MTSPRTRAPWRLLFLLLAVALLAGACGDDDDAAGDDDGAPTTVADGDGDGGEPTEGELDTDATLRVGWSTMPNQLDPHMAPIEVVEFRAGLASIYDRLFTINPDIEPEGMLVTDWGYSDDGLTLTLDLREDVEFRDGTSLDAEVVKLNLDRARELESPAVQSRMTAVEAVEVLDDYTVALTLAEPTPEVPFVLAQNAGLIMHPDLIETGDPATETNGSGLYTLESFTPGEETVLVRDDDHEYWDDDAGKIARFEHTRIADPSALASAMEGGQIDLAQFFPHTVEPMLDAEGFNVEPIKQQSSLEVHLNRDIEPLDVLEVRQAINYALDKEGIVEALYPTSDPQWQTLRTGTPGSDPDLEGFYAHDPDRARELLEEAGFADGVDLGEMMVTVSSAPGTGEVVQEQLAQVGIRVQPAQTDSGEIFALWPEGNHATKINFGGSGGEPGATFDNRWRAGLNPAGTTPEYEELLSAAADNRLSVEERNERYAEVTRYVVEQAWSAPLLWVNFPWVTTDRVVGFEESELDYSTSVGPYDLRYLGMLAE